MWTYHEGVGESDIREEAIREVPECRGGGGRHGGGGCGRWGGGCTLRRWPGNNPSAVRLRFRCVRGGAS
eukprot:297838-Prorocentrum_minimum.AAC.1